MATTRAAVVADLEQVGRLVEQRAGPDGAFGGWDGRAVLIHLAGYTRVVAGLLRGVAEHRSPTDVELYGRELTEAEQALTDLDAINDAVQHEYAALAYAEARAFWRATHADAIAQAARLTESQLSAPGPPPPSNWSRPHLADVVTALIQHYHAHMEAEH